LQKTSESRLFDERASNFPGFLGKPYACGGMALPNGFVFSSALLCEQYFTFLAEFIHNTSSIPPRPAKQTYPACLRD
jgi:hypothetical protein